MAQDLNKVDTELMIAGTKTHFVSLQLQQAFNAHHILEARVDFEEMDKKWMDSPAKLIGLIGEPVNITMKHKQTLKILRLVSKLYLIKKGIILESKILIGQEKQNIWIWMVIVLQIKLLMKKRKVDLLLSINKLLIFKI